MMFSSTYFSTKSSYRRSHASGRRRLLLIAAVACLAFLLFQICSYLRGVFEVDKLLFGTQPSAGSVLLSIDGQHEPAIRRCLANFSGFIARYTDDEAYAATDPRNPDRVIAVWQTRSGSGSVIQWSRSLDGGKTWTPIRPITPAVNQERIGAPQITIDARSGRLYAVYHRRTRGAGYIGVIFSDDRGDTWSPEAVAVAHVSAPNPRHPNSGERFVLADDIVQAVVSPKTGQLVIAYADARRTSGKRHDVSIVWSVNGTNWSQPLTISDRDSETAWLPAIAANANGEIALSYFSASFEASANARTQLLLQRLSASASGLTPIDRVLLDEARLKWPGDYQGLVATKNGFLAVYGRETDIAAKLTSLTKF